jgi:putative phosphoesterase
MKIGVLSDSHDRLDSIELAIDVFNKKRIEHVFHAGDIISPFTSSYYKELNSKLHIVWGNNDGDKKLLTKKFKEINALIHGEFMNIAIENRKIAMIHGTDEAIVKALVKCGDYQLIIRGHTHKPKISGDSETLLLNPGTPSGYLNKEKTIAIVDLVEMDVQIIKL